MRFACEYHNDSGNLLRAYSNESWEFDEAGLMSQRIARINEHPVAEADHRMLSALGL